MLNQTSTPSLPTDLKYANRLQVINAFLTGGTFCVNDIAALTGLSRQTVTKSVQFLLNNRLLTSIGKGTSTNVGGKRPELFSLSDSKFFLCITLWPNDFRFHIFTIGNVLVDSLSLSQPLPDNPRTLMDNSGQIARMLLEKNHISLSDLCAVSISTSGIVDYKKGLLKFNSQAPEWGTNIPIRDYLQPYFSPDTMIFIENAGKMTARPYLVEPELAGKRTLIIFACWGVSSCLIEKQHILSGKNSLIGEIGHMILDPNDPEECGCGSQGCFERFVSPRRLCQIAKTKQADFPDSVLFNGDVREIRIPELFAASSTGDSLADFLVEYLADAFALALRNISLVFDPDLVVFQGDYSNANELFDRTLRSRLQKFHYFPAEGPFEIHYDRRSLEDLNTYGSYIALSRQYFDSSELLKKPD